MVQIVLCIRPLHHISLNIDIEAPVEARIQFWSQRPEGMVFHAV